MTRLLAALAFLVSLSLPAAAQNFTCPDVPHGDSSNRCANTRFVQNNGGGGGTPALPQNQIFIGNASNVATAKAMTGDCTIVASGAITCFATPLPTSKGGLGVDASAANGVPLFAAGTVTFVLTTGTGNFVRAAGATMTGAALSSSAWTGGTITGLPTCTVASDACPKSYIDSVSGGNTPLAPVRLVTVAVLSNTPTYANGAAGVGATLTAGSNGALSVDGTVVNLNDRVLVKDQAAQLQNGPYSLTTLGTGGVPYVLTRTTDADTAAELPNRLTTLVTAGATLGGSSWTLNQPAAITVGTTALPFVQTASPSVSYWTLSGSDIFSNNAGNVGIGTATPTGARFIVVGSPSPSKLASFTDGINGSLFVSTAAGGITDLRGESTNFTFSAQTIGEVMRITNTGHVGIGTTNPSAAKLVVFGAPASKVASYTDGINGTLEVATLSSGSGGTDIKGDSSFFSFSIQSAGELMRLTNAGSIGVGTTTPTATTKMDIVQGTGGSPITAISHSVNLKRTEQLASPLDTQGAQNAALNVESFGTNTSVVGVNIAQPVGIRGYAQQLGSGDAVGGFFVGENNGTGTYAAFGLFSTAVAHTSTTGAISIGTGTGNNTGVSRSWSFGGPWLFVGIDLPYASYGTANKGEAAALVRKTDTGAWSCGYCIASGGVADWAYFSQSFTVDSVGNEVALSNTAISDERLKTIHGPFSRGLAEILQIKPILYNWNSLPDGPRQAGVSAQDVQRAIPEAVSEIDSDGHLGVSDRPLIAALINSVKELKAASDNLRACHASWRCRIFGP